MTTGIVKLFRLNSRQAIFVRCEQFNHFVVLLVAECIRCFLCCSLKIPFRFVKPRSFDEFIDGLFDVRDHLEVTTNYVLRG